MNAILEIPYGSDLDLQLERECDWYITWEYFVKTLDKNIIEVKIKIKKSGDGATIVTFKDEQAKMFFLLRYA